MIYQDTKQSQSYEFSDNGIDADLQLSTFQALSQAYQDKKKTPEPGIIEETRKKIFQSVENHLQKLQRWNRIQLQSQRTKFNHDSEKCNQKVWWTAYNKSTFSQLISTKPPLKSFKILTNKGKQWKLAAFFRNCWRSSPNKLQLRQSIQIVLQFQEQKWQTVIEATIIYINKDQIFCKCKQSPIKFFEENIKTKDKNEQSFKKPIYKIKRIFNSISYTSFNKSIQFLKKYWMKSWILTHLLEPNILKIEPSSVSQDQESIQIAKLIEDKKLLNDVQNKALNLCLQNQITVIQGPPGTGKSTLSAQIIAHLIHFLKEDQHIMVCAPSNVATDGICQKLALRLGEQYVLRSTGQNWSSAYLQNNNKQMYQLCLKGKNQKKDLDSSQIIKKSRVICSTLHSSIAKRHQGLKIPIVLIDEATQCVEPQCFLPLICGAKRVIFVGDHKQLGPVINSKQAKIQGYEKSLFERLIQSKQIKRQYSCMLNIQYRMDPRISRLSNMLFYNDKIENGIEQNQKTPLAFEFVRTPQKGKEFKPSQSLSYSNNLQAIQVIKKVKEIVKNQQFKMNQIGIITPYNGQKFLLKKKILQEQNKQMFKDIEVNTIDSYQGREMDVILISTVRSQGLGFLSDQRRINVAISRARKRMVIFGSQQCLKNDSNWQIILQIAKSQPICDLMD